MLADLIAECDFTQADLEDLEAVISEKKSSAVTEIKIIVCKGDVMLNSIVTIICIALIAFILIWFSKSLKIWTKGPAKKGYQEDSSGSQRGYTPELIILKKSVPARIVFDHKDPSPYLDQIVFPDFGVHADLPMGEEYVVEITPETGWRVWFLLWHEYDAR